MSSTRSPTRWRFWARMCSAPARISAPAMRLSIWQRRWRRCALDDIPGVGKAIAEKIGELIDTGQLQFYEKLRAKVPAGVLEMLRVPNIGPRTAGRLYSEF